MKNLDNWARPARAAADARDELRSLVPALDRAIGEKHPDVRSLERVRDGVIRHSEALTALVVFYRPADRWPFGRRFSTLCGVGAASGTSQ